MMGWGKNNRGSMNGTETSQRLMENMTPQDIETALRLAQGHELPFRCIQPAVVNSSGTLYKLRVSRKKAAYITIQCLLLE